MAKKKQTKKPSEQNDTIDAGLAETEIFEPSPEVAQEFVEAQRLGGSGGQQMIDEMLEHNSKSPVLSGGDLDAAWDKSDVGEEAVSGSAPTPDQDIVEELGKALGINYEDNEPLRAADKLNERDINRWELDPASSEGFRKRSNHEGEYEGD
jgi:hypothetical protein